MKTENLTTPKGKQTNGIQLYKRSSIAENRISHSVKQSCVPSHTLYETVSFCFKYRHQETYMTMNEQSPENQNQRERDEGGGSLPQNSIDAEERERRVS